MKYQELIDASIKGDQKAYAEFKLRVLRDPQEVIAQFESNLDEALKAVPEDLFGRGFGYDVRGNALEVEGGVVDMTPMNVYLIGRALAGKYANGQGDKVLLTGDQRIHTPIFRLVMALGAMSTGARAEFSEEILGTGEHVILSRENEDGYRVMVQTSGSHGVPEKNGLKIKLMDDDGYVAPLHGQELTDLYNYIKAGSLRTQPQRGNIVEISGLVNRAVSYYLKTLPKVDPEQPLIIDCRNSALIPTLKILVEKFGFKDVTWVNDLPDGRMPGGIWDPSKREALENCVRLVKAKNLELAAKGSKKRALGFVPDGDGDRMVAIDEEGKDVLSFEMVLPFYQRFLSDPVNQNVARRLVASGYKAKIGGQEVAKILLVADIRSNSTLLKMIGMYSDFKVVYIQPGYSPQWEFMRWQVSEMRRFVDDTPALKNDKAFIEDLKHFIHSYFTGEASGHQFFHVCPYHPEYIADAGIAVMFNALAIKGSIQDIEAKDPNLKLEKKDTYELKDLFAAFPKAISSDEVRLVVPNSVKAELEKEMVTTLVNWYGDKLRATKRGVVVVSGMRMQDVSEGQITPEGIKIQLKTGGTALFRKSNTGEQVTLMFEGATRPELVQLMEDMVRLIPQALATVKTRLAREDVRKVELDLSPLSNAIALAKAQ